MGIHSIKEPFDISVGGVAASLRVHAKPSLVGLMLVDLLKDAGYDDDEIHDVATAMMESTEIG
jgi:hypothetical protein